MAAASDVVVMTKEDIQVAMDTLGFLTYVHEAQFGPTAIGKNLQKGLHALEIAGYVKTIIRDPERGISEAIQGTLIAGMDKVPLLYGLNVAGEVSSAILPTLRATEKRLAEEKGRAETLAEYREAMGIFVCCAAYNEGVKKLAAASTDAITGLIMAGAPAFIQRAVMLGLPESVSTGRDVQERVLPSVATWAEQLGQALQRDKRIKPIFDEYNAATSGLAVRDYASVPRVASGKPHIDPPKPAGISAGMKVFGSTASGIGAAVTVSAGITVASILTAGLAAVSLAVASILLNKHRKAKAKEFRKQVNNIEHTINEVVTQVNDLCASTTLAAPEKIATLQKISSDIDKLTAHGGMVSRALDPIFGGNVARPAVDQLKGILWGIQKSINTEVIPALSGGSLVFGAARSAGGVASTHEIKK